MDLTTKISVALVALFLWAGSLTGIGLRFYHKGMEAQQVADAQAAQKQQKVQEKVTTQVVTKYVPQIQEIQGKTITLIKKVPIYVTKIDDTRCVIPNGFVSLWNAANEMSVPGSAGSVDAAASEVVLSEVAAEHAEETGITHADEAQLVALQEWIRNQQKVSQ